MDRRDFIKITGIIAGSTVLGKQVFGKQLFPNKITGKQPNILLIMTDQQAATAMSWCYGQEYLNTPSMDELASEGIVFTNAYTANPLCVPCRTSMFTGMYPHQTNVQSNSDIKENVAGKFKNMGIIFKDAGYATGYVGKWHMAFPAKEAAIHGFDFMRSIKNTGIDEEIPAGAEEFLKIKREKPFLLVTSFVNPHNICEWARDEKLPDGEIGKPPSVDECPPIIENPVPMQDEPDIVPIIKKSFQSSKLFPVGGFDENKWREYRWAYFRMIEKVDALIGRILTSLRESGEYDNTVIVFTSDHGDMQGAHGWNQKTVFFEESTRVPLIIKETGKNNQKLYSSLINTGVDILPTLCGYAGINLHRNYPGINLKNNTAGINQREYVVVQNKMVQGEPIDGYKPEPAGRMVRSKKYKYCIYDIGKNNESLVDLEKDPLETKNLAGQKEYNKILKQHRKYLIDWCAKNDDQFTAILGLADYH